MLLLLDYLGVIIFAVTGALVGARRGSDIIGFVWLATVTGIGGGTVRDLILDRPVFWLHDQTYLTLCLGTALIVYFCAHWVETRMRLLLWLDALGLAVFAVIGTQIALDMQTSIGVALVMGVLTATLGGVLRDLLAGEPTLILRKDIYVAAAAASALTLICLEAADIKREIYIPIAITVGFGLRGAALRWRLMLPGYSWVNPSSETPVPDRRQTS